jgi:hypothetical protein
LRAPNCGEIAEAGFFSLSLNFYNSTVYHTSMDVKTTHNLMIEGESEDVEALKPMVQDIAILLSAVEEQGPAIKQDIVDGCRSELKEVMQENTEERIKPPGDLLDILATYGIIEKDGIQFQMKSVD